MVAASEFHLGNIISNYSHIFAFFDIAAQSGWPSVVFAAVGSRQENGKANA
jgi:hypothetical protein